MGKKKESDYNKANLIRKHKFCCKLLYFVTCKVKTNEFIQILLNLI